MVPNPVNISLGDGAGHGMKVGRSFRNSFYGDPRREHAIQLVAEILWQVRKIAVGDLLSGMSSGVRATGSKDPDGPVEQPGKMTFE